MKEFDNTGSKLCSYQAEIFSCSSSRLDCSSPVFLRRFFHSGFADKLDNYNDYLLSYDIDDCFNELNEEYGKSSYGRKKYPEPVLHWLGYITRYICYTREISSKKLIKTIPLKLFTENYEVYHTQSEEWVIDRIIEVSGSDRDIFNKNAQIKKVLKKIWML